MTTTEKRIEVIKLLQTLKQHDEKPGDIILRALRQTAAVHKTADRSPEPALNPHERTP